MVLNKYEMSTPEMGLVEMMGGTVDQENPLYAIYEQLVEERALRIDLLESALVGIRHVEYALQGGNVVNYAAIRGAQLILEKLHAETRAAL